MSHRAGTIATLRSRLRYPPLWLLAALVAAAVVLSGALPGAAAVGTARRTVPVLLFLVGVSVLAELAGEAGVFDAVARYAARLGAGRTWLWFALVLVATTAATVLLSLDTTAVLMTPVILAACTQLGLDPLPFAMATVWLANTASLLLPVSNLTNLLAMRTLDVSATRFAGQMGLPAVTAVAVTAVVLICLYAGRLRGRYTAPPPVVVTDRVLFAVSAVAVAAFAALVMLGVAVAPAALICAGVAVAGFLARRRSALKPALVPWRLVVVVFALFLIVAAAHRHGLGAALARAAGSGSGLLDLLRLSGVAAAGANLVNNLPAYLALEPTAGGHPTRLLGVLIGVNTGPLLTMWGSLATLLWAERCRAAGVRISARAFLAAGALLVPAVIGASTVALWLGQR
jgi:arsenical pump membrane protein